MIHHCLSTNTTLTKVKLIIKIFRNHFFMGSSFKNLLRSIVDLYSHNSLDSVQKLGGSRPVKGVNVYDANCLVLLDLNDGDCFKRSLDLPLYPYFLRLFLV